MRTRTLFLGLAAFLFSYTAMADGPALKAKHEQMKDALAKNAFGRPLVMESTEGGDSVKGELHAVIAHPLAKVADALSQPAAWCEILVMPMHLQKCNAG